MAASSVAPLIVIVGPTASGKTSLAVNVAERYNGEIICADSRTIYRDMDIGTAKPTPAEQRGVPHWGLDLVNPDESFSVAMFQAYAKEKIAEIRRRERIPFLVGGSGLYVDAVLFNFGFGAMPDDEKRTELEQMDLQELQEYCFKNNGSLPKNSKNKRHIIRSIESSDVSHSDKEPVANSIVVGIATRKNKLRERVAKRADCMIKNNVVKEATDIMNKFGVDIEVMSGGVYSFIKKTMDTPFDDTVLRQYLIQSDMKLAKKQMTWFRKNPFILWGNIRSCEHYLLQILEQK